MTRRGQQGYVGDVAFSPDGKLIASSGISRVVKLWDAASGKNLLKFQGHQKTISSVVFSPDGKRMASSSNDGTIRILDVSRLSGR